MTDEVACALDICDGSGWIPITDFTGGTVERCPCGQPPEDEQLALARAEVVALQQKHALLARDADTLLAILGGGS